MAKVEVEDRMMAKLASRIEALEKEVAECKQLLDQIARDPAGQPLPNAWQSTVGRFKDDPTHEEAVKLGRAWRKRQPKC